MPQTIYIFGTGSHARKIFHYVSDLGWTVECFIDEATDVSSPVDGLPVINAKKLELPDKGGALFVAIGNPLVRARLMDKFSSAGWLLPSIVHRTAWVAPDAVLGSGVLVGAGAIVETAAIVERGAIVDIGALIDHDAKVLEFSHLKAGQICGPGQVWPLEV